MHDDPVGQHGCIFAVGAGLPLPLTVKLHAPLISETVLLKLRVTVFYKYTIKIYK